MKSRAKELLQTGEIQQVLAWQIGDLPCYPQPAFFTTLQSLDTLVYDQFCTANLSRYMIGATGIKTLVFMRPCDTYSYNQLLKENQVNREDAYIIGVGCQGYANVQDGEEKGLLESCMVCTKTTHMVYDELINEENMPLTTTDKNARFTEVTRLEELDADERYAFWQAQLSKCIRCNACRNICPTCHCKKCVFDNDKYDTQQKANASQAEEQMFHITRAFHVAGRCSDCGQCSRVCPQNIPLHLLNRKFIKDIDTMYGEFRAGEDVYADSPLTHFNADTDPEPRGGIGDV